MTATPALNASRKKWADFLAAEGIDVPAGATRSDLVDLWNLNRSDEPDTGADAQSSPMAAQLVDYKPSPDQRIAAEVPAELSFSTGDGEQRTPEVLAIKLNGRAAYLYEPSLPTLIMIGATLASPDVQLPERIRTMMNLLSVCLDTENEQELRAAVYGRANSFRLELLGELTAVIFQTWAPSISADTDVNLPKGNRAQRRAARK